jgi:hypothetical protein
MLQARLRLRVPCPALGTARRQSLTLLLTLCEPKLNTNVMHSSEFVHCVRIHSVSQERAVLRYTT